MPVYTDYLADPRYSVRNMTATIENIPNMYTLLADLGMFPEQGIPTTYVEIEAKRGTLNIIPTSQRGGPRPTVQRDQRNLRVLKTIFMALDDTLRPSDLQNLPAFGNPYGFDMFDRLLMERMDRIARAYRQTHEYMRWGALRGNVYDADGTTVLYNCYTEMGESQVSFDFLFGATGTNGPTDAVMAVRRYFEQNALGEPIQGMIFFCSAGFMDKLRNHPNYVKVWENQQTLATPIIEGMEAFRSGNNLFIEHNGRATHLAADGTTVTHEFVPADEAIGVPVGTIETFRSYFAPAEMMSAVNLPGQSMYVSLKELDHDGGIEIHTQSAPLFVVQKPRLVVRAHSSN